MPKAKSSARRSHEAKEFFPVPLAAKKLPVNAGAISRARGSKGTTARFIAAQLHSTNRELKTLELA